MTKDFFISYNRADATWAEWIAWVLEEHGKTVVIQAWDFRPGGNFILDMQRAAQDCDRTIAVLSEDYLNALYTQPEWAAAFKQDPTGIERKLLPVRVALCKPTGLLAPLAYVDLVGKSEAEAETLLLGALQERAKPTSRPSFPQSVQPQERITSGTVTFPQNIPEQSVQSVTSNTALRLALFQNLASLPSPQFEQILFALSPPPGNVASAQAPQGNRVKDLLDWATSIGPGLSEVEAIYNQIARPR
ncbi:MULTISPECIES: TIR domain-containing protein [Cyanophyceae]|uniref:Toll/interleukin-1 receptor domain-containing protein n=1 Tax=Leptolyngbya subtilissima DQ-A4 TaxID=2933933 RepID=A0ABV0KC51_9CYAN|nr:toll/interleukin-1 receptor domain-containing protein [Nodosilinea sp. FACHB-141]MBD2114921.1 toll/interleukin-1 receptor domain-containing protein [Nodosilinea sp. FACHB-141]